MLELSQILVIVLLIIAIGFMVFAITRIIHFEKKLAHIDENLEAMIKAVTKKHKKFGDVIGGLK